MEQPFSKFQLPMGPIAIKKSSDLSEKFQVIQIRSQRHEEKEAIKLQVGKCKKSQEAWGIIIQNNKMLFGRLTKH